MWKSLLIAGAMALVSTAAQAQQNQCNQRDNVLKLLSNKYSESRVAVGVTNNGGLVEVLKSAPQAKADTWTIIITSPQGVSCLIAAGEGWRALEQLAQDPET
ncbi:MAG: hypothetical protein MI920_31325 [Kiloniellales bacterium]|nr:hypothetical protein [Kiloniellales bacterium]